MTDYTEEVFKLIRAERKRQDEKWGSQRSLSMATWVMILGEEFGEVCKAVLEHKPNEIVAELIQLCAVGVCWLESTLINE